MKTIGNILIVLTLFLGSACVHKRRTLPPVALPDNCAIPPLVLTRSADNYDKTAVVGFARELAMAAQADAEALRKGDQRAFGAKLSEVLGVARKAAITVSPELHRRAFIYRSKLCTLSNQWQDGTMGPAARDVAADQLMEMAEVFAGLSQEEIQLPVSQFSWSALPADRLPAKTPGKVVAAWERNDGKATIFLFRLAALPNPQAIANTVGGFVYSTARRGVFPLALETLTTANLPAFRIRGAVGDPRQPSGAQDQYLLLGKSGSYVMSVSSKGVMTDGLDLSHIRIDDVANPDAWNALRSAERQVNAKLKQFQQLSLQSAAAARSADQ